MSKGISMKSLIKVDLDALLFKSLVAVIFLDALWPLGLLGYLVRCMGAAFSRDSSVNAVSKSHVATRSASYTKQEEWKCRRLVYRSCSFGSCSSRWACRSRDMACRLVNMITAVARLKVSVRATA